MGIKKFNHVDILDFRNVVGPNSDVKMPRLLSQCKLPGEKSFWAPVCHVMLHSLSLLLGAWFDQSHEAARLQSDNRASRPVTGPRWLLCLRGQWWRCPKSSSHPIKYIHTRKWKFSGVNIKCAPSGIRKQPTEQIVNTEETPRRLKIMNYYYWSDLQANISCWSVFNIVENSNPYFKVCVEPVISSMNIFQSDLSSYWLSSELLKQEI